MNRNLRFTGEWPPEEILRQYPNWEYALDEEGVPGQDETTLKPQSEQGHINIDTVFTVGEVLTNDGNTYPAILEMSDSRIEGINTFTAEGRAWRIYMTRPTRKWVPFEADWLSEAERPLPVSFDDQSVFPITVTSLLPKAQGSHPMRILIESHGFAKELEQ
jgi:hypothetical protein